MSPTKLAPSRASASYQNICRIEYVFEDGGPDNGGLIAAVEALHPSCQRHPFSRVEMSNLARVGLTEGSVASIFRQRIILRTKRVGLRLTSFTGESE
jgi:hypothetical protein